MNDPALRAVVQHAGEFGLAYEQSFLNAVPEPGSAAALMTVGLFMSARLRAPSVLERDTRASSYA